MGYRSVEFLSPVSIHHVWKIHRVGGVIPVRVVRKAALGKARGMGERLRGWIENGPTVCSQHIRKKHI